MRQYFQGLSQGSTDSVNPIQSKLGDPEKIYDIQQSIIGLFSREWTIAVSLREQPKRHLAARGKYCTSQFARQLVS